MTPEALLKIENLELDFWTPDGMSHVLNGVSLSVGRAERVAVVGESGCGKSATLRSLLGLHDRRNSVTRGRIVFDGQDLSAGDELTFAKLRGKAITLIVQDPIAGLNPMFTIGDQLTEIIRRKGLATRSADALKLASDALLGVAIRDPARILASYPHQVSGGQAQRVMIVAALLGKPQLVLADEPGTALDVTVQKQALRLMEELAAKSGTAVLLITHNLGVVREFADRVYVMYAGQVVELGAVDEVFSSPRHPYTQALFAAMPRIGGAALPKAIEGAVPDFTRPPSGCRFRTRCKNAFDRCASAPPRREISLNHDAWCWLGDLVASPEARPRR